METKTGGSEVEGNPQTTQQVRSQTGLQEAVFKKRQEKDVKSKFLELFFSFCHLLFFSEHLRVTHCSVFGAMGVLSSARH